MSFSKQDITNLHRFMLKGRRLIYDRNSCSALELDKVTWDILEAIHNTGSGLNERLVHNYGRDTIFEVLNQLNELRNTGLLFSRLEPLAPPGNTIMTGLVLFLTYGCNLDCNYCFTHREPYAGKHTSMDKNTAERTVDFLIRHSGEEKNLSLCFFGGEPLLNFSVMKHAIEYAKSQAAIFHKNFQFSLTTNAVLLDKEVQKFLNENKVSVIASLDGPKDIHDTQRHSRDGNGSYTRSVANLQEFRKTRGPYGIYIRATFTRHTIDSISDMMMHILQLGFHDISIEPAILPMHHKDAIRIKDLPQVKGALGLLADTYLCEILNYNPFLLFNFSYVMERLQSRRRSFTQCGAACGTMSVSPTGELYACLELVGAQKYRLGDVYGQSINRDIQSLFQSAHVQNKRKCKVCWAKYICGGGCHAHAFKYNGDIYDPCDVECQFMRYRIELGIWLYAVLSKDAPKMLDSVLDLLFNRQKYCRLE